MPTSTKKSVTSLSPDDPVVTRPPEFNPSEVLANIFLAEKLKQLFDDFERPARMLLQRQGLNSEHETQCLAEWVERQLRTMRGELTAPAELYYHAFA